MVAPQVKVIGSNGQLSLGKEYAGKSVVIDQVTSNTWIIKTGTFIPDSEQWLHQTEHRTKLEKALSWSEQHAPTDNFDEFIQEKMHD